MDVYVIGTASTVFRKWPETGFRALAAEAVEGALADARLADGADIEQVYFGNCAMGTWGQANIRGQTALMPLQRADRIAQGAPVVNVEGGCATGSLAFHGAVSAVVGGADAALAVGVEKTWVPEDPRKSFALFAGGIDQLHTDEWKALFAEQGAELGWKPHPARIIFLDVHALEARHHMARHGTTVEQIAAVASRHHHHGALNPKAQYRFEIEPAAVLADKPIVAPLTRSMCCPLSDGAAAAVVVSGAWLDRQPAEVRARAIRVRACTLAGGRFRGIDEGPSVVQRAAAQAYARAGIEAKQVEVVELHDATAACPIRHVEALGFCAPGEGGAYATDDIGSQGGARPMNLSGGLISKGHPLGATGLGMIDEVVNQLRGEAGDRQAQNAPTLGLVQNAGGLVSFDEALCGVSLLERAG